MGSKTEGPAPVEVKAIIVPRIPLDIIDEILNHLPAGEAGSGSLQACSLVSKSWIPSCRQHLFRVVNFTSKTMVNRWLIAFPVPEQSPAHHVRRLGIWLEAPGWVPEEFFEHTPWFTNVRSIYLSGRGMAPKLHIPSHWRLPESVTSLTVGYCRVTLVELRGIMARLPNLDNLALPALHIPPGRRELPGIGTVLKGRVGGKLILHNIRCDSKGIMNMLLEVPTGLRFTEVEIDCARGCLPSVVTLVEACCKTIVKLSHKVTLHGKSHPFSCLVQLTLARGVVLTLTPPLPT